MGKVRGFWETVPRNNAKNTTPTRWWWWLSAHQPSRWWWNFGDCNKTKHFYLKVYKIAVYVTDLRGLSLHEKTIFTMHTLLINFISITEWSRKQLRPMLQDQDQDQDLKCQGQDQDCRISVSSSLETKTAVLGILGNGDCKTAFHNLSRIP